jgi:hypothetical protein
MTAIEEANEPMVERWPHYVTKFQVLLADRRPAEAASLLADVVDRLDGGPRERVKICILAAAAFEEKWRGGAAYEEKLTEFMAALGPSTRLQSYSTCPISSPNCWRMHLTAELKRISAIRSFRRGVSSRQ